MNIENGYCFYKHLELTFYKIFKIMKISNLKDKSHEILSFNA